ncbi:LytTR family DNA-binding domain-containing protein [Anaerorhabdus sp.]|jgi:DNA-binding LytR/AlgR family response regulator|uniref:LytTR family DNA-binding domain-containing protein n=1 Tax=Anaerorhabdus sp. TaxID=1872524 RepID=UPI002B1F459B|nr:LytTR family DNA-binding domain-containing protein [Anaerorhabdus sp.]MEA4875177.1 LytTR family DNA-binding domain-containing protein [Anaerorhabdus sp.]
MKLKLNIDSDCEEVEVQITAKEIDDEVNDIVRKLEKESLKTLVGFIEDEAVILEPIDIIRIYTSNNKILAETKDGEYKLRYRIYECEEKLNRNRFIRISQSELINLSMVKKFDFSITGTIHVVLKNGVSTFVSRRYVSTIRKVLGV